MIGLSTTWILLRSLIICSLPLLHAEELGEAFFNTTGWVKVSRPLTLYPGLHMGLSFRTCQGGQLFVQSNRLYSWSLEVVGKEGLAVRVNLGSGHTFEARLKDVFNNNQWHYASILHKIENITLSAGHHQVVIANSTLNTNLLKSQHLAPDDDGYLLVGSGFIGCIKEGPNVVLSERSPRVFIHNVEFGKCPLTLCSPEDRCHNQPCMTHGVCITRPDNYYCQCNSRFSGRNCEVDDGPPCLSMPCQNNAHCEEDNVGNYKCHCPPGFIGKHCEAQVSGRVCENNPCQNNSTCIVSPVGSYKCVCLKGFSGNDCEINIDECLSDPCQNGGTCIDDIDNYTCNCASTGYKGRHCEDNINECEEKPCLNSGTCFDTYGSYSCECPNGFTGQNCEIKVQSCNNWLCQNGATCEDQPHGFKCNCPPGYSGVYCEVNGNGCQPGVCPPNADCFEHAAGIQCICKPGYTGLPSACKPIDACLNSPCHNGGTCSVSGDGFNCSCVPGFTGPTCQTNIEECASMPCQHGGCASI
ncbi:protein crumbs-like isoform X1 [Homalodisca vitripennis]|uniref:protein crumbs-like isoform X1 n=1 Tax=Homalodisca vitripennis TaxID=197043 RepID=UPI001EEC289B|nr:protein crumbs-like isoform X1 [Homalodisca vitripennis]